MSTAPSRFTAIPTSPQPNWERDEIPRYRVVRAVRPSGNDRFRTEPPFSQIMEADCWQYAEREYPAGEIVETRDFWPHPTFQPQNYAAKMVLQFFNSAVKSRLARSPFSAAHGRLVLNDGLTGTHPNFAAILAPRTAA